MKKNTKRWFIQSVAGLLLTGAGLSICIHAGVEKLGGELWFYTGTLGLVIFQTGLCLVIDGVRYR
ncbi:MAG: hypothetical protein LW824_21830 [Algoriphagus sp.]|jgi:ABC-type uncharacterized transport system permease subunit|nr:hypothetical protein [Algoriphagus sp.]MCE2780200.1 hypothetical protein [Algoriphagus sp.]